MLELPAEAGALHGGNSGPHEGRPQEAAGVVDMDLRAKKQDQLHAQTRSTVPKPHQLDSRTQKQDRVPVQTRT